MYIAYIDESGRPFISKDDSETFVLACLIAHENQWQYIDNKVNEIKMKHFPNLAPEDVELHAKAILNRDGLFKKLNWDQIYKIFNDIFNFIAEIETFVCIIGIVIMKQKMQKGKDIEKWAYRLLVERVNKFLEKNNEKRIEDGFSVEYGIMIIDSCGITPDSKLRKKIAKMLKHGTYYSKLKYLIEDPLFSDSKWRNLSQLVDCVAYSMRKNFRNPQNPSFHDKNWKGYYDQIHNKFDTNEEGKTEGCGLKIFP